KAIGLTRRPKGPKRAQFGRSSKEGASSMIVRRFPRQAVIAASIFSFVLAMQALPARADDDGDDRPWDSRLLGNLMEGLGLQSPNKGAIVYQERAPLVIPPSTNLPVPEKADAAIAN